MFASRSLLCAALGAGLLLLAGCGTASTARDLAIEPASWPSGGGSSPWPAPSSSTPPPASDERAALAAIAFAEAQVGRPYCWGGTGPRCFDCSGLVQAAWRSAGTKLPRTAEAQRDALVPVPLDSLEPGDILYWRGHVGLYVGGGQMVDALNARSGVVRRRLPVRSPPERAVRVTGNLFPGRDSIAVASESGGLGRNGEPR